MSAKSLLWDALDLPLPTLDEAAWGDRQSVAQALPDEDCTALFRLLISFVETGI